MKEKFGYDTPLRVHMGCHQIVAEVVMAGVVSQRAVADIILHTRRHLQHGREHLAHFRFQMDLVLEIMVVVADDPGLFYIIEDRGIGNAGKQAIASPDSGSHRGVGIEIVLCEREPPPVDVLPHGSQVIAYV